ncbi:MAG: 30S ribosomal protein S12 methylthiotransferase RimO [Acidimicrobiia bacterium]
MSSPTVWLTTLGCAKNQVDSEKLTAMLAEAGYTEATDPARADVVMVNTCAFIEAAREESVETILELEQAKKPEANLVVLGCMAQRFGAEISEALPEADAVLGLDRYGELIGTLDRLTNWQPVGLRRSPMDILHAVDRPAPTLPYAYVKVAEGCDKPCTFCAIPLIRGKQRSRRPVNIHEEMSALAAGGVQEIVLVAQDLASYGRDIHAPGGLVELLRFVSDIEGLRRLRLLYLYPKEIRPALIEEMAANPLIVPYFDLSLQHAEERLLRAMRRPGNGTRYLDLIARIRATAPAAALRSSFIVGFPGETGDDVETLAEFLRAARLDWAGFFPYSAEDGTPAANLPGRLDPEEVTERLRYLQAIQDDLTHQANGEQIGRAFDVLIDQVEDGVPVGRTYREAPDIDGMVMLDRGEPGEWVQAVITASYGVDLAAKVVER